MRRFPRLASVAVVCLVLFGPGAAHAFSFYAEILTSSAFSLAPDVRASLTATVDFDPFGVQWTGTHYGPGSGLGAGYVDETHPLLYSHVFDPTPNSTQVLGAWLFISVIDDAFDLTPETAEIYLDGGLWQSGQAFLNVFFGDIIALGAITADNDLLHVAIVSKPGTGHRDFRVSASVLKVTFAPAGETNPIPEPGTGALMGLGLAALAAHRRAGR